MSSEKNIGFPSEILLPHVVSEIHNLTFKDQEKLLIQEKRDFFNREGDLIAIEDIERLRAEAEPLEKWRQIKEKARKELEYVPSDILEKLLSRFEPYIKALPAGHSRGHFLRDAVNITAILQDPKTSDYDAVEIFVGISGGVFHDIANSVANRYEEQRRFSAHAEIGAYLFGEVAKDLLPENLLKLAKLAIAGHTHYLRPIRIFKEGQDKERQPYDDEVIEGNKMGMWLTRQADRLDAQGVIMDVRHIITKADPTEDFSYGEFHPQWDSPEDDFRHQFKVEVLDPKERKAKSKPENAFNVLEHIFMFANSNFNPDLPYPKNDSEFYTNNLIRSTYEDQLDFIRIVVDEPQPLTTEQREQAFEDYFSLIRLIEPAFDTEEKVEKLRTKFKLLLESEQNRWARGFRFLVDVIYPRHFDRVARLLKEPTRKIKDPNTPAQLKVQGIIDNHLHPLAVKIWEQFDPGAKLVRS